MDLIETFCRVKEAAGECLSPRVCLLTAPGDGPVEMDHLAAHPLLRLTDGGGQGGVPRLPSLGPPVGQTVPGHHPPVPALVTPDRDGGWR